MSEAAARDDSRAIRVAKPDKFYDRRPSERPYPIA
jgi:hypothetical protein